MMTPASYCRKMFASALMGGLLVACGAKTDGDGGSSGTGASSGSGTNSGAGAPGGFNPDFPDDLKGNEGNGGSVNAEN